MKRNVPLTLLGLVLVLSVSACGLRGGLERPAPLWGDPPIDGPDDPRLIAQQEKDKADAEARRKAAEAAAQPAQPAQPAPTAPPAN